MHSIVRAAIFSLLLASVPVVRAETVEWIRQFGTNRSEPSFSVAADPLGNVFVSAETLGSLAGPNSGPSGNSLDIALFQV